MRPNTTLRLLGATSLAALHLSLAAGCAGGKGLFKKATTHAPATITLDGSIDEWPADAACVADEDYIYFRLTVEDSENCLQASPEPVSIWLDLDDNPGTGQRPAEPHEASTLGVDLEITFSPLDTETAGRGVIARAWAADGTKTDIGHADIGLMFAPTHSAPWFEGRISRHAPGVPPTTGATLADSGRAAGIITLRDSAGELEGWSDLFAFRKPRRYDAAPRSADAFPARDAGTIRVMSWNVLHGGPARNQSPYDRIIQALQPDVILIQEWPDASAAQISGWFTAVIPSPTPWQARVAPDTGVAIVSPFPIAPLGPDSLSLSEGGEGRPIRWVGGVVSTPHGDIAVSSIHLKCCGSADSPEDLRRREEARAINDTLRAALADGPAVRLIGGDLNLVGTEIPARFLAAGLDADASDLTIAQPRVVGDATQYTWFDPESEFSAGRLDYAAFSDAAADIVRAFVVDTRRLDDAALARLGLDRADSDASDHLPVVIDLRPRN